VSSLAPGFDVLKSQIDRLFDVGNIKLPYTVLGVDKMKEPVLKAHVIELKNIAHIELVAGDDLRDGVRTHPETSPPPYTTLSRNPPIGLMNRV